MALASVRWIPSAPGPPFLWPSGHIHTAASAALLLINPRGQRPHPDRRLRRRIGHNHDLLQAQPPHPVLAGPAAQPDMPRVQPDGLPRIPAPHSR